VCWVTPWLSPRSSSVRKYETWRWLSSPGLVQSFPSVPAGE
jgi:hypothetical protein